MRIRANNTIQLNSSGRINNASFGSDIDVDQNKVINLRPPTNPGDAVSKSYADVMYALKTDFEANAALPGFLVTSDLVMSFVPTLRTCSIYNRDKVRSIQDPISKTLLTSTNTFSPTIKEDSNRFFYLEFNDHRLENANVPVGNIGGQSGNTTTFFFIGTTKTVRKKYKLFLEQFC